MQNIWIFGATGYVGRSLTKHLLTVKEKDTVITTLAHRNLPFRALENTNLITGSLEHFDLSWLERFPPDVVFHCARLAGNNDRSRRAASHKGEQANERLIQALEPFQVPVIYCSGTLMYGNQQDVIDENTPLNPIAYAKWYERAERPWTSQSHSNMDIRMARPAWILGFDSWFYHFFYLPATQNKRVPYYGDGNQRMSLLHVDDCGGLLHHIFTHGQTSSDYNLFVAPPITQKAFAEMMAEKTGLDVERIQHSTLKKMHGSTVTEALTSDIPVRTAHTDWHHAYTPIYPTVSDMLDAVLASKR